MTPEDYNKIFADADCLYTGEQVAVALDNLAIAITGQMFADNPLVLCVVTGSIIPTGHLLTRLHFPLELDYLHATRYKNTTKGGELDWYSGENLKMAGRNVLIVDDILDEGLTLDAIVEFCKKSGAIKVYTAVLVEKIHDRKKSAIKADFVGLQTEDRYLFGYGMDYEGYFRNANGIYAVKGL
ncbi:MAG: hypoxanthine-guanine phosphoribosyltransferase [Gammaproteobacteria bacterium]|nr:hypoxanthine-guanine phosphoribosyltransferase [Gammaproteobacteria bacterium]